MADLITHTGEVCVVDDADYPALCTFRWYVERSGSMRYARTKIKDADGVRKTVRLHRLLLDPPRHLEVDHINGNGLDNRRSNLRVCTHAENACNKRTRRTSTNGLKGMSQSPGARTWEARIRKDGKAIYLGRYPTMEEAARAYDEAAITHFGEFACLNYPAGSTEIRRKEVSP